MDEPGPYDVPAPNGGPPPEERRGRVTLEQVALGVFVGALFAVSVCVAAVLAFDVGPAAPVVVVAVAVGLGSMVARNAHDPAFKSAAIGLVVGGVAAVLLWPVFPVDSL
ncbi:MAG TPA: hypothetical protein VK915_07250 [Gaiellaceae bacterium]|nr:hypothetical protein [Gaiellaceae bacterium]